MARTSQGREALWGTGRREEECGVSLKSPRASSVQNGMHMAQNGEGPSLVAVEMPEVRTRDPLRSGNCSQQEPDLGEQMPPAQTLGHL